MAVNRGGGVVVDSGNFDWMYKRREVLRLCTWGRVIYHGLTYTKTFRQHGVYHKTGQYQIMRDLGEEVLEALAWLSKVPRRETLALDAQRPR